MGTIKYLIDTHTLLWVVSKNHKLSKTAKEALGDFNARFFVSSVSAYEIMYKFQIGKLHGFDNVAGDYLNILQESGIYELPISTRHAHFAGKFEWSHRDPFDRLLAAQAFIENMTLITNDEAFNTLPWVNILW